MCIALHESRVIKIETIHLLPIKGSGMQHPADSSGTGYLKGAKRFINTS